MKKYKRIVVKVGTKVITSRDRTLDTEMVSAIASQVSSVRDAGTEIVLVTSGAIGAGIWLMGLGKRPKELSMLQAAAAVGQNYLMGVYSAVFKKRGYLAGQILLTQDDFNDRKRYLNIEHTIDTLLKHRAIPVINENDTVATEEIRCGDNDRLSALVSGVCGADALIMLTDVEGLLDEKGGLIRFVDGISQKITRLGGKSHCDLGTGGMITKLGAARIATRSGIDCIIANGRLDRVLEKIVLDKDSIGTVFKSQKDGFIAKKRWLAYSSRPHGSIRVDNGARDAIAKGNKSLLASGILGVTGKFISGDAVSITDADGIEFARGQSNYSADEVMKIKGVRSSKFKSILGYETSEEVIHIDNLVIL